MTIQKPIVVSALVFALMFLLGASGLGSKAFAHLQDSLNGNRQNEFLQATPAVTATGQTGIDQAVQAAFQQEINKNQSLILGAQIYDVVIDNIQYSEDNSTALLWLGLRDQETGQVIETEPGLSIANNASGSAPENPASWSIMLQTGPDFNQQLRSLPDDLLTEDIRARFLDVPAELQAAAAQVFGGYKLPWTAGVSKRVTNSIGHVYSVAGGLTSCPTSCRFAFDFADGTMFPLLAAKGGAVKSLKTTCANFDSNCTNYLILEDQSTIPTTYQVYYHMANNSVPERLRTVGAVVQQGEYIGDVDDTGFSTGHHLHFHVYTTPNAANWSWGNSVDITFDDVSDNGGRPRTCAEVRDYANLGSQCQPGNRYTSGNTPVNPPSGSLDLPGNRQWITSRSLHVQGTASDDIQVTRIQVQVNYDGEWKTIDDIIPIGNGTYAKDVDLCTANVPDGPLTMTVRIYDREGSLAPGIPVQQLVKNYSCGGTVQPPEPPACTPNSDQVALYADTDYRGACQLFNVNNQGYTVSSFGILGDDNAASIQVGSNVAGVLYDRSSDVALDHPAGRIETFTANDAGLADNLIGADHVSGLWVVYRNNGPKGAIINPIGSQMTGNAPTSVDSLVLSWEGGSGATSFEPRLTGPNTDMKPAAIGHSASVGNLAAGTYTFTVTSRNPGGAQITQANFTVSGASLPAASTAAVPYSYNAEAGTGNWIASGLWRRGSVTAGGKAATMAWVYNNGANYEDKGAWRAGDLTSPPIAIPAGSTQYLRFLYFMDTEDGSLYWDQRRVQVSVNNGPFQDLLQLSDDKQNNGQIWLNSSPVSLAQFAGAIIRLRFHFDTIDEDRNSGVGWAIDEISITNQGPLASCDDSNNSTETAQATYLGETVTADICPQSDQDYYRISGKAGQQVTVDINAKTLSPGSRLDSLVQLIDADGRSVIAENDDEELVTLTDSLLNYTLNRDGNYFVKVKAWNHPAAGGRDYPYQMSLVPKETYPPQAVRITYPAASALAPVGAFTIQASAVDFDGGPVASMEFFYHSQKSDSAWVKLGVDTTSTDGWSYFVDPGAYGQVTGSSIYVQATSKAGGVLGAAVWDLAPDQIIPISQLNPLPAFTNSTAVLLTWNTDDSQDDIARFEVDYQASAGGGIFSDWQRWNQPAPSSSHSVLFVGAPGSTYRFRTRAVDYAGNVEAFPNSFEGSITLATGCTPDSNEIGQSADAAVGLTRWAYSPTFNLCKSAQDGSADVDWVTIDAEAGEELILMISPTGGGATLGVSLYHQVNGLLNTWRSPAPQAPIIVRFQPPTTGRYYLEIKPTQPNLFGSEMTYRILYGEKGALIYMPRVSNN